MAPPISDMISPHSSLLSALPISPAWLTDSLPPRASGPTYRSPSRSAGPRATDLPQRGPGRLLHARPTPFRVALTGEPRECCLSPRTPLGVAMGEKALSAQLHPVVLLLPLIDLKAPVLVLLLGQEANTKFPRLDVILKVPTSWRSPTLCKATGAPPATCSNSADCPGPYRFQYVAGHTNLPTQCLDNPIGCTVSPGCRILRSAPSRLRITS